MPNWFRLSARRLLALRHLSRRARASHRRQLMLRRRGLPGTLHLGVAKEGNRMEAHAWLRCGDQIVTGGHELERFGVVARFGRPVLLRGAEQRSNPHLAHSGKAVLAQRESERQP